MATLSEIETVDRVMETTGKAQAFSGVSVIEYIGALLKPKLFFFAATSWSAALLVGVWFGSAFAVVESVRHLLFIPEPRYHAQVTTSAEIERHIEANDKRLDGIDDKVAKALDNLNAAVDKRFDRLEEDRRERRDDANRRFVTLENSLSEVSQRVWLMSGGIGILGFLVSVGILKLRNTATPGLAKEDLQQLALLAQELKYSRSPGSERKRP